MVAGGALGLRRAGVADLGADPAPLSTVAPIFFVLQTQNLPGRADVVVALGIVAEAARAEEGGVAEVEVGEGEIRLDGGLLDGRDVLARVPYLASPRLPAGAEGATQERSPPKEIEHRAILGDLRRADQYAQDDAGFAAVHRVVGLVAELRGALGPGHGGGVGAGPACSPVGGSFGGAALQGGV